jgi:hypothetical protein
LSRRISILFCSARRSSWPFCAVQRLGRARQLCPGNSDLDFFTDLNGIVNLDAKVANGALDLCVAQQQLDCTQIARSAVDQCGFRPPQRVRAELERVETDIRASTAAR